MCKHVPTPPFACLCVIFPAATNAGLKRPVYLQSTWLRSRAAPKYPIRYQYVVDLIEELTLCKYHARPHWVRLCPFTPV